MESMHLRATTQGIGPFKPMIVVDNGAGRIEWYVYNTEFEKETEAFTISEGLVSELWKHAITKLGRREFRRQQR